MPRDGRFSRRTLGIFVCLGLLLVAPPGSFAYGQSDPPRDAAEAWKWMQGLLKNVEVSNPTLSNGVVRGKIKSGEFTIHLAAVSSVTLLPVSPDYPNVKTGAQWYEFPSVSSPVNLHFDALFVSGEEFKAQRFQSALIYLARKAQQEQETKDAADLEAFKPKAITEYTEALRIFPYWPEGQNNLAFLAGEMGTRPGYNVAIDHMKMYLELAPNAPDAQAAQDSIFIWEDKRTTATP